MFVLSASQAFALLKAANIVAEKRETLVDVGAGDGEVSLRFASLYSKTYATEISASMRKALAAKRYT